ncbi:DNA polymerase IV [Clavibacter michiganensis subsp. michiganensis]|nr:DNA polymerase IV [Clavibacter michiganensis subsp. michiganensis]
MSRQDGSTRRTSDASADDSEATILHIDMDAFFAAVELLERPELRGTPVIVGGSSGRGVVTSATYEARRFGVRSAMPMAQALRLCPQATVIGGHMEKYAHWSRVVMGIFRDVTPLVEPLSIDEAFLDVAGARGLFGSPAEIGAMIRRRVHAETGLTCSVGAASTKFVAKLASTRCKPDGLLVIPAAETLPFLHALPVGALWEWGRRPRRRCSAAASARSPTSPTPRFPRCSRCSASPRAPGCTTSPGGGIRGASAHTARRRAWGTRTRSTTT